MEAQEKLDHVQFGRLIESVESMKKSVEILGNSMEELKAQIAGIKEARAKSFGVLTGIALAAGSSGAAIHKFLEKII